MFIPAGSGGIGTFAIQLAKHLGAKVGTTTSTGNVELVRSLGADEVVDYKKQDFEKVLRGYDAVLGTVRGDAIEKSIGILKPGSKIVSLVGPLDAAFARARRLNFILTFVFALMSRKIMRLAKKRDVDLLIPLCASRRRSTRADRRAPRVRAHPPGDRQGVPVRTSQGST